MRCLEPAQKGSKAKNPYVKINGHSLAVTYSIFHTTNAIFFAGD